MEEANSTSPWLSSLSEVIGLKGVEVIASDIQDLFGVVG